MSEPTTDRNLLFGVLALQMDFISRDALIAAMNAWVLDKGKPLGQLLREQRVLGAEEQALLEALVQKHLERHDNDLGKSLAAVSSLGPVRQDLETLGDVDLRASLAYVKVAAEAGEAPLGTRPPSPGQETGEDPQATRPPSVGAPSSAGQRFRILRPHARGGLGQVHVARDEELHREVALKEIQAKHADDPGSRARFLLEAEVTGRLEHPGVVPVYSLGTYADGRPYYAMRFIKGDSLAEAIERFHKADGPSRDLGERSLELRKLLGRFLDVCNAIDYAHSRGVLHRDLKPGNVMLGQYGETLVVDWGLAKPTGRREAAPSSAEETLRPTSAGSSAPTQAGKVLGTPAYMSPEQAAGRLDELGPASDVYSLGATLYVLLTGKPAFEGPDVGALLQQVQRGEFPLPRQRKPAVPPALEAVCLKAMALTPEDRYPSARALADDVEHWLADEPVSAHREPWGQRLARWGRRHRAWVQAAGAALLVVAAAAAVTALVVSRAWREEQAARARAERNLQLALDTNISLGDLAERLKPIAGTQSATVEQILRLAADNYEHLLDGTGETAPLLEGKARMLNSFSEVYIELGNTTQALETAEQARSIYQRLHQQEPGHARWKAGLASSEEKVGVALDKRGKLVDALAAFRASLALRGQLAEQDPDNPDRQMDVSSSHSWVASVLELQGDYFRAEEESRQALAIRQRLVEQDRRNRAWRSRLGESHLQLGSILSGQEEGVAALAAMKQAQALFEGLTVEDPAGAEHHLNLTRAGLTIGVQEEGRGELERARASCQAAKAIADKFARLDPSNKKWQQLQLLLRVLLARLRERPNLLEDLREKLPDLEQLHSLAEAQAQKDSHNAFWQKDLVYAKKYLAAALAGLAGQGVDPKANLARADELLRAGVALSEAIARKDRTLYVAAVLQASCWVDIANIRKMEKNESGYRAAQRKAAQAQLDFYRQSAAVEPDNPAWQLGLAEVQQFLGPAEASFGNLAAALAAHRQALECYQRLARLQPKNESRWIREQAEIHAAIGRVLYRQAWAGGKAAQPIHQSRLYAESVEASRKSVALREQLASREPDNPQWHWELYNQYRDLGPTLRIRGDPVASRAASEKCLGALERFLELQARDGKLFDSRAWEDRLRDQTDVSSAVIAHQGRLRLVPFLRAALTSVETDYRRTSTLDYGVDLVHACLRLALYLDTTKEEGAREARWALRRGLSVLRQLQSEPSVRRVSGHLIPVFEAQLKKLPKSAASPVAGPLARALDELDYRRLAASLSGPRRYQEFIQVLDQQAQEAVPVAWVQPCFHETVIEAVVLEPGLQDAVLAAARDLLKEKLLGAEGRRLIALLAWTAGDPEAATAFHAEVRTAPLDSGFVLALCNKLWNARRYQAGVRMLAHAVRQMPEENVRLSLYHVLSLRQLGAGQTDPAAETLSRAVRKAALPVAVAGTGGLLASPAGAGPLSTAAALASGVPLQAAVDSTNEVWLGLLYYQQRRFSAAENQLRNALRRSRLPAEQAFLARLILAGVAAEVGDLKGAESALRKLLDADPTNAVALNALASLSAEQNKDLKQAEEMIRKALQSQPDNPGYLHTLGWVLCRQNRAREGLPILEKVVTDEGLAVDLSFWEHLGDAYSQVGRQDKARECWQKALQLFPRTTDPADRRKKGIERKRLGPSTR